MKPFLFLICMCAVHGCSPAPQLRTANASSDKDSRDVVDNRCSMEFQELFFLAKGREWTESEVRGFQALNQEGKNRMVKQLAAEAGCIQTEDQVGTDGIVYTAFWRK